MSAAFQFSAQSTGSKIIHSGHPVWQPGSAHSQSHNQAVNLSFETSGLVVILPSRIGPSKKTLATGPSVSLKDDNLNPKQNPLDLVGSLKCFVEIYLKKTFLTLPRSSLTLLLPCWWQRHWRNHSRPRLLRHFGRRGHSLRLRAQENEPTTLGCEGLLGHLPRYLCALSSWFWEPREVAQYTNEQKGSVDVIPWSSNKSKSALQQRSGPWSTSTRPSWICKIKHENTQKDGNGEFCPFISSVLSPSPF